MATNIYLAIMFIALVIANVAAIYANKKLKESRKEYSELNDAYWRFRHDSIFKPLHPFYSYRFIMLDNCDNSVLTSLSDSYTKEGYQLDDSLSSTSLLVFTKTTDNKSEEHNGLGTVCKTQEPKPEEKPKPESSIVKALNEEEVWKKVYDMRERRMTVKEVAAIMGISQTTVSQYYRRYCQLYHPEKVRPIITRKRNGEFKYVQVAPQVKALSDKGIPYNNIASMLKIDHRTLDRTLRYIAESK